MPKVSIIVNTVDRVTDLKRCLDSVYSQKYRDFEVVVVNNGLGQETNDLLSQETSRFQEKGISFRIVEDKTKKLSYLFNLGWKNSHPEVKYFAYLADDTEADPLWLESAINYLESHTESGAVSGPILSTSNPPGEMNYLYDLAKKNIFTKLFLRFYEYFVMEGKTFEPGHWCQSGAFTMGAGIPQPGIKEPVEIDLLTSGNMVVTRAVMEKVGGFDEHFLFNHADGDLFIRIKKAGYNLIYHPQVKVIHHMRFGPTRYPQILGRDTAFYYLKDVRPKSVRGWVGAFTNLLVFKLYFVIKAIQTRNIGQLRGITGFIKGVFEFFWRATPERNGLLAKLSVLAGFLLLFVAATRGLWHYGMLAYGDATPFPNNFGQAFRFFFNAYDPRSPEIINPQDGAILSSLIPLESALAFILGGNFIWAQRIFHLLPIPLSFVTMYFFLSQFSRSRISKFLASFIYSGNHFMVAEFAGGFEGNLYIPALLPVFLILLKDIYLSSGQRIRRLRLILIYSALLSVTYVISDHVLLILVPFWALFVFAPFVLGKQRKLHRVMENLVTLLTTFMVVLMLSAYHSYVYLRLAIPYLIFKSFPKDVIPFFVTNVWDTYWKMGLGNTLRLGGSYFSDFFNGGDGWARTGFVIPLLAISWILFSKNRKGQRLIIGAVLSILALGDVIFIYLSSRGVTIPIMTAFPVLFRFRNPSRLSLLLAFFYAPLICLSLEAGLEKIRSFGRPRLSLVLCSVLIFILVGTLSFYFKGFFSGDFTLRQHRGDSFWIGERYYKLGEFMDAEHKKSGFFRTLYIPWTHEETEVKLLWVDPYTYSVPITYGAYIRNEYINNMQNLYGDLATYRVKNFGQTLNAAGVKYVVVNTQSKEMGLSLYRFDYQTPWLLGSFNYLKDYVAMQPEMRFVKAIDGFAVYENTVFDPGKINVAKAASPALAKPFDDSVRRGLMGITFVSWLLLFITLVKTRHNERSGNYA